MSIVPDAQLVLEGELQAIGKDEELLHAIVSRVRRSVRREVPHHGQSEQRARRGLIEESSVVCLLGNLTR